MLDPVGGKEGDSRGSYYVQKEKGKGGGGMESG